MGKRNNFPKQSKNSEVEHYAKKAEYTDRPLTAEEREYAAEHHGLIFKYMKNMKLDPEEWYDLLIIDYLQSVKRYFSNPQLHKYGFVTILFRRLDAARQAHFKAINAQKRMPEGGLCSLDYEYEDHKQEHTNRVEPWWIDPMQNVERYVVEKKFLNDIYSNIHRYAEPDLLKLIVDMRQEGYSNREIARKAVVVIEDYRDWGIMEVVQIIVALTKTHNSALQRLYRDTEKYGDIDRYHKWEDARENW